MLSVVSLRFAAVGAALSLAGLAHAQVDSSSPPPARPGLIRAGSLYLTPYLDIGNLGLDTNVLYSATDRRTDFNASGGPGLEIVRPFDARANSRVRLDGAVDYLYYVRTESQRKLNGHGSALVELHGVKTDLVAEESYMRSFSRPSYQVDARLQQETAGTRCLIARRLGERFQIALFGERQKTRIDTAEYLGTDLRPTMSEDRFRIGGELRFAVTVKTGIVGGGEQTWDRFPYLPARDGRSTLAFAGFRTDDSALIAGHALAGVRWFRLNSGGSRSAVYADVDAVWGLSPKTKLGGRYARDLQYSIFATSGRTPTNVSERAEVSFDKMLVRRIYLRLSASITWLRSDGAISIVAPEGTLTAVRDDSFRNALAEIGYQFRPRVRVGLTAGYAERRSSFETFGIQGLLAGLTVTYNPPQPRFR